LYIDGAFANVNLDNVNAPFETNLKLYFRTNLTRVIIYSIWSKIGKHEINAINLVIFVKNSPLCGTRTGVDSIRKVFLLFKTNKANEAPTTAG
jgi:hypothetical protein